MFLHHRRSHSEKRHSPLRIVLAVILLAVLLTVIVGNVLRLFLTEEDYTGLREQPSVPTPPSFTSTVRHVRAYHYTFGTSLERVWETSHASVSLNTPEGALLYKSPAAAHLGFSSQSETALASGMAKLQEAATYVSGVFYPQAVYLADELCDAEAAKETALMREFLRAGGDEILLLGLPFSNPDISTVKLLTYVRTVNRALGDIPLSIALPLSVIEGKNGYNLMAALSSECDVLALDLRGADSSKTAEEWLNTADYYLSQYSMRLILSESQTELLTAAERISNLQTVRKIEISE